MSFTCSICQELLTERPQNLPPNVDSVISSLPCGLLFHYKCVEQWFKTSPKRAGQGNRPGRMSKAKLQGVCPFCKKKTALRRALRIFPTGPEVKVAEEAKGNQGSSSNSDAATEPASSDADPAPRRSSRLARKAAEQKRKRSSSSGSASSDEESGSKTRKDRSAAKRPATKKRSAGAASKKKAKSESTASPSSLYVTQSKLEWTKSPPPTFNYLDQLKKVINVILHSL